MTQSQGDIVSVIRRFFGAAPPDRIGVAVSGGGDSLALMHGLASAYSNSAVRIYAATVDHGLRPESASEAAYVGEIAADLSIEHTTLHWSGWDGAGNLQSRARDARGALLSNWARGKKILVIALGHTADDQAETVLMRLARGAGVDGLSAMDKRFARSGITLCRPLLDVNRLQLRRYLHGHNIAWMDDPSNEDLAFDRVKARKAIGVLAPLGITIDGLTEIAENMRGARDALNWYTFLAAKDHVTIDQGALRIDVRGFRTLPSETARRLFVRSIAWLSGEFYAPRRASVLRCLGALRSGEKITLCGVLGLRQGESIWLAREFNAVQNLVGQPDRLWDNRWRVAGPKCPKTAEIRALGAPGLSQCPQWRDTMRPRDVLLSAPGLWDGATLLSAPAAGFKNQWSFELEYGAEGFYASIFHIIALNPGH